MNDSDNRTETRHNHNTIPGPPVPFHHNASWKLLSQGAEARIWLVPNFIQYNIIGTTTTGAGTSTTDTNSSVTSTVICKERFPKTYRHASLDETLTKSRTKAEAKNLTRCRRGGVSVPLILGVDLNAGMAHAKAKSCDGDKAEEGGRNSHTSAARSACLFMEYISGCTVRSFLNVAVTEEPLPSQHSKCSNIQEGDQASFVVDDEVEEPCVKKQRLSESQHTSTKYVTRLDEYATRVAYQIGVTVAKMHNVNIVHGDLTTSNMILRNGCSVPPTGAAATTATTSAIQDDDWIPDIVLIDFGLSSTSVNTKKTSSHEERAVDLYVLERSFVTTHVGSEGLVKEIMRGYKATCQSSDSVFVRLAQVRLRGRKRECFG
jgi:Mn2+-dependent serine/threonine protein kinase